MKCKSPVILANKVGYCTCLIPDLIPQANVTVVTFKMFKGHLKKLSPASISLCGERPTDMFISYVN